MSFNQEAITKINNFGNFINFSTLYLNENSIDIFINKKKEERKKLLKRIEKYKYNISKLSKKLPDYKILLDYDYNILNDIELLLYLEKCKDYLLYLKLYMEEHNISVTINSPPMSPQRRRINSDNEST